MTRPTVGEYQLNFTINHPRALRMCRAFKFSQLDFDAGWWIFKVWNAPRRLWMHMLSVCCDELLHKKFYGQGNHLTPRDMQKSVPGTLYDDATLICSGAIPSWKKVEREQQPIWKEFPRTTLRSAGWWNVPAIIRKMAYRCQWQNTETHQHTVHLWDRNKKAARATRSSF